MAAGSTTLAALEQWRSSRDALNKQRRLLVVEAWNDSVPVTVIARELGVSRQTVYEDLHAAGAIDNERHWCAACAVDPLPHDLLRAITGPGAARP